MVNRNPDITAYIGADYKPYKPETFRGFFVTFAGGDTERKTEHFAALEDAVGFAETIAGVVFEMASLKQYRFDSSSK
ncbi:hypothetical protein [Oryzifoliimicrobium ureilyticus]|uniref:hypothetical protein n=1 Tax=Oryzifoliimicrobium ureilyticus TaxID=3113724 RepID=UPI0030766DDF